MKIWQCKWLFLQSLSYNQILFQTIEKNMACRSEQLKRTSHGSQFDFGTPLHNNKGANIAKANGVSYDESTTSHQNKLPVNLFYSAAEYNKMLITNGKSIRKRSEPQIQEYIQGLQFINDTIFQSCEQKRQSLRGKLKNQMHSSERKKAASLTEECVCCCCDQYCKICSNNEKKIKAKNVMQYKLSEYELQNALKKINSQPLKSKKKKVITSQAQKIEKTQKKSNKVSNSEKQCSSSYLSHKSFNIDKLVSKSLVLFEKQKRLERIKKLEEKRRKAEHEQLMKRYEQQIRQKNRHVASTNKSKSPQRKNIKSQNSYNIRAVYWQSIKGAVALQLKKERSERTKSKSKPKVVTHHESKYTPEMIIQLREKREKQAKQKIAREAKQKQAKKRLIRMHLKQLQRHRRHHIQSCDKKKFQPTEKMIEQAFKNIIDQAKINKQNETKTNMKKVKR